MQLDEKIAVIEAVLFASGEPVETARLAQVCEVEAEFVPRLVRLLSDRLENGGSAFEVLKLGESYQLATKPLYAPYIRAAIETKKNAPLSPAAMEVLAIVAYNQPVTKSFVEHVRGVDSAAVVNSLTEKNLLEEAGRLDIPGRPVSYRTTDNFLRCFKLSSLCELPVLENQSAQLTFDEFAAAEEATADMV
ncbi:MAG: SMC-Scp complex subunit ScpB [Oscillospiraceae bacterium]